MILALLALISLVAAQAPQRPQIPERYFIVGTFSLPTAQPRAIVEPMMVWTDTKQNLQRVDYFGGVDQYYLLLGKSQSAQVVPRVDKKVCFASNDTTGQALMPVLPALDESWAFSGTAEVRGSNVNVWTLIVKNTTQYGSFVNVYKLSTAIDTGLPVEFVMNGVNTISDSHPDNYVFSIHTITTEFDDDVFTLPALCAPGKNALEQTPHLARRVAWRVGATVQRSLGAFVAPNHHKCATVSAAFVLFATSHRRHYASCAAMRVAERAWQANKAVADAHNAAHKRGERSHTLSVFHHFTADLDQATFKDVYLLPRASVRARRHSLRRATRAHVKPAEAQVPRSVDWRQQGAVTAVSDQAACGSCWTFGSVESLAGVSYLTNPGTPLRMLSPQQLVDCAYGPTLNGCDGGFASGAYEYLMKQGGVATDASYPYKGQDYYCDATDKSGNVVVTGYTNVTGVDNFIHALSTAPVAIAIDASVPDFRFYRTGIYANPACKNNTDSLDHEIVAIGYDLDQNYALMMNSWSNVWGDQGYVKFTLDDNECGFASQATQPIVKKL